MLTTLTITVDHPVPVPTMTSRMLRILLGGCRFLIGRGLQLSRLRLLGTTRGTPLVPPLVYNVVEMDFPVTDLPYTLVRES